jgi:hypothetical protein
MMNEPHDDDVDALLQKQFDGAVPDEGFCERVMQRLPPRRRRATWPVWTGILVGAASCWMSLQALPVLRAGWRDWMHGAWSPSAVTLWSAMACMTLLAFGWALLESREH